MRWSKVFALIQGRVERQKCLSRWSARHRASWSASGRSAAAELLECRCLLAAGDLDPSFGVRDLVKTSIGILADARSVAIRSDGKSVVANSELDVGPDVAIPNPLDVERYLSDHSTLRSLVPRVCERVRAEFGNTARLLGLPGGGRG